MEVEIMEIEEFDVVDPGGYDYHFVEDPPESLRCLICLLVARNPQQHGGCGKLFCDSCITRYQRNRDDCPNCRQPLSNDRGRTTIFNDFKSDQEVKSLKVVCTSDCGWKGELGALDDHIEKDCDNTEVPCPNKCRDYLWRIKRTKRKDLTYHLNNECPLRQVSCPNCEQIIEYRQLDTHTLHKCPKRQYSCPKCNEDGIYDERTTTHLAVCPKVKVKCSKCSLQVFRCDTSKHPLTCTHEPVACKYYEIGCTERPLRKDVKRHEEDAQFHLTIATDKVLELTKKQSKKTYTFKMIDFEKRKASNNTFYSPPWYTSRTGYKMCFSVYTNGKRESIGTHVSVYANLMKGDNDDSLTWPFTGTVTFELLNQLEDRNHHKQTSTFTADRKASKRVVDDERGTGWGKPQFISHAELDHQPDKNCQYLKDDILIFRVSVQVPDHKPWLECDN